MALLQERKQELISEYQVHETDTGSPEVQVALLTDRINSLTTHLQANPKDYASRRGLMTIIGKRKRLLGYIQAESPERYFEITKRLNIRVKK
ncbi:30S ribosomal protein S15 [Synechococcus sp. PCC 7336]|uniref:30S ribosomal protein S15 n=1 Tax=Synechococcus sp. PCC 7336 TaxID=195250 RepID=UPI00034C893B|nr:30S ribosomal protein S15 [Synechococcus sp. PCC 7336]